MNKYLIEVHHGGDQASCIRYIQTFLRPRKPYVKSVEWACLDGENKAWLIVKTVNQEDALRIIPAIYREDAKLSQVNKLSMEAMPGMDSRKGQETG